MKKSVCIIGAGNLGLAIASGLLKNQAFNPKNLIVSKRNIEPLRHILSPDVRLTSNNLEAINNAEIILIAVKPYDLKKVLEEIKPHLSAEKHILISVATGISISEIRSLVDSNLPVYRAMPNTASDVGQSMTCIATDQNNPATNQTVSDFFDLFGKSVNMKEELMDAATVLGACGIAYALRFIRSMTQGGIQIGFDAKIASQIVNQVIIGAVSVLNEKKTHPEEEIDKVTTPKGCTIFGLNEMEHNGFSSSLIKGIETSFKAIG